MNVQIDPERYRVKFQEAVVHFDALEKDVGIRRKNTFQKLVAKKSKKQTNATSKSAGGKCAG